MVAHPRRQRARHQLPRRTVAAAALAVPDLPAALPVCEAVVIVLTAGKTAEPFARLCRVVHTLSVRGCRAGPPGCTVCKVVHVCTLAVPQPGPPPFTAALGPGTPHIRPRPARAPRRVGASAPGPRPPG